MANFYSNENFPLPTVVILRAKGHDVLTTHDVGNAGKAIPDKEVLDFAIAHARCVLTQDRDFKKLHKQDQSHEGIILTWVDTDFQRLADDIDDLVRYEAGGLKGKLLRVFRGNR